MMDLRKSMRYVEKQFAKKNDSTFQFFSFTFKVSLYLTLLFVYNVS